MRTRWISIAALSWSAWGCEGVASVDLHSADATTSDADGSQGPTDGGALTVTDGAAVGEAGSCGCEARAGEGCCLQKGASFCTIAGTACTNAGGIFLGCAASNSESGECCWNGSPGVGGSTAYAGSCGARPRSCTTTADCLSGTCQLTTCGGLVLGACGVVPVCP